MNFHDFEHHRIFVNGVRLHVRTAGTGDPVLLLHGWLGTSYTWRKVAPTLAENFTVIMPDMRGFGDSDKPESGYDGLNQVEDMRQLLQQLELNTPHVVGHDMGTLPAYLYAATYPSEVKSLTYLDEPLPGFNLHEFTIFVRETFGGYWHFGFNHANDLAELLITGKERQFIDYLLNLMTYNPAAITEADKAEYLRTYAGAGGVRGSCGCYRAALDTADQFKTAGKTKLKLPVLAYGGQYGLPGTKEQMFLVAENVEGGIIPNCGHLIPEEVPDFLTEQLSAFFQRV
jgi:pimeloyl-ACP methyl ester carboxylesterase